MEEREGTKPAPSFSPPVSSIPAIIRKAIRFLLKNEKLMLQLFILVLIPFLILALLHTLIALPFIGKVEDGFESSALDLQDLISLVIVEIPFAFALCLLLLYASAITISAASHQGGLKETLLSIKSTWTRVLISGLYASCPKIAFVAAATASTRLTALIPVLAALTFPYFASICSLVLVISTVDDEYPVWKIAFRRAREVTRQGRFQGYFLMFMLVLLNVPVYALFYVTATDDDDANGMITQFAFVLVATALLCMTNIFTDVVCTLFYLDYKQRNGNDIEESVSLCTAY
ncbi:hypothetical protein C2S53_019693 [Perilla frutescens var. hirtella]|uniref:Uncharacterized protein n=1 Tax=Perilla frutescens var. hirtella TaxID=608512 RepID=A0AAD4IU22_PERFH|nr:hypothetical protein C2S53_019693 [Perilla frutescens var. hirtella]